MRKRRKNIGIYKHSEETKRKISFSNSGKLSSQWKGNRAKYQAVHSWIRRNYGNATHCENKKCNKKSKNFEWALIHNTSYIHDITHFMQMCRSCHHKYDMTEEIKNKIRKKVIKFIFCTIKGCKNRHLAKGLCRAHYLKARKLKRTHSSGEEQRSLKA